MLRLDMDAAETDLDVTQQPTDTEAENILPGSTGAATVSALASPETLPPPLSSAAARLPAGERAAVIGSSLPAFWAARVRNKAWQARQRRRATAEVHRDAGALLKLARDLDDADAFRRQLTALRFEAVPLLDGAISVFDVPSGFSPHEFPQLVSERTLLAGQESMDSTSRPAGSSGGAGAAVDGEAFVGQVMQQLGLLHTTEAPEPGCMDPSRDAAQRRMAKTQRAHTDMCCFVAPVSFASDAEAAEVRLLLRVCLDLTVKRADATLFDAAVPQALGANVWQEQQVGVIFVRARVLNFLWVALLLGEFTSNLPLLVTLGSFLTDCLR